MVFNHMYPEHMKVCEIKAYWALYTGLGPVVYLLSGCVKKVGCFQSPALLRAAGFGTPDAETVSVEFLAES